MNERRSRMTSIPLALLAAAFGCGSCTQLQGTAQAGYAQMAIDGRVALSSAGGGGSIDQDVKSSFGIGDPQGAPYVRAQFDFGTPVITVSAFTFDETGAGTLEANFGSITSGTPVTTDLRFTDAKVSLAFDIPLGPVKIAPGLAADLIYLEMNVRSTLSSSSEELKVYAPVPLAFVRAEADLGLVGLVGELGYVKNPNIGDVEGTVWDGDVIAELHATRALQFFAGYRVIAVKGNGTVDDQDFATDLRVSGWNIGGGLRF
jgi:hypothetical protein